MHSAQSNETGGNFTQKDGRKAERGTLQFGYFERSRRMALIPAREVDTHRNVNIYTEQHGP